MRRARPDQKAALEAKRKQLRDRVEKTRSQPRKQRPTPRRKPKKKNKEDDKRSRWWWFLLLLLLLPMPFCRSCSCTEPPPGVGEGTPVGEVPGEVEEPLEPMERIERRDRPEFAAPPPAPLPWIDAFRMQVAARSPRLAECFVGTQRPGTLKWTTSVEPSSGAVSDHEIEPMLQSGELTRKEQTCVLEVLSEPPYRLQMGEERSTPSRVGLVIEF